MSLVVMPMGMVLELVLNVGVKKIVGTGEKVRRSKQRHLAQLEERIIPRPECDRGSNPRMAAQLVLEALVSGVVETLASGRALCERLRKRTCPRVKGHEGTGRLHHWELV